jgi:predicted AlkP superfamily pyrophosphatase or phosphodiesterase
MLSLLIPLILAPPLYLEKPRLAIILVIDQFRPDYLTRFSDLFLPATSPEGVGGFRFLMERGAHFVNAKYTHIPTETAVGHAVISTGSIPAITGIIGNRWFDTTSRSAVYCVQDPNAKDVLTGRTSYSAGNLLVTTLGDELKKTTGGQARVVSLSLKDRGAILLAGRRADLVLWEENGSWTTSTAYAPKKTLPEWVIRLNQRNLPAQYSRETWTKSLSDTAYQRTRPPTRPLPPPGFQREFPHPVGNNFIYTPFGNDFVLEAAKEAIQNEQLGQDDVPDLLGISLSTHDYLGHAFGPDSPEILELTVRTDRQLADFFRFLEKHLPNGLKDVVIVFTSDHGIAPIPEDEPDGTIAGRLNLQELRQQIQNALEEYEIPNAISHMDGHAVYLDEEVIDNSDYHLADVEYLVRDILRSIPGIHSAYTRQDILEGFLSPGFLENIILRSFHSTRSGNVLYITSPGFVVASSAGGTHHGTPWHYDSAVPLIFVGSRILPGIRLDACGPEDIAPTLAGLLGTSPPSGSIGRSLVSPSGNDTPQGSETRSPLTLTKRV